MEETAAEAPAPEKPRKKRGPVPGPETEKYTVLIAPDLAEWGKYQPGGLSETIRVLMQAARAKEQREQAGAKTE